MSFPAPLDTLSPRDASLVEAIAETVRYPAGERIVAEGDDGDSFFVVDRGQVRFELDRVELDSEAVLAYVAEGAIFGELAVLDRAVRSASAYAHSDVELRRIDADALEGLLDTEPRLYALIISALGRSAASKLRRSTERLAAAVFPVTDPDVDRLVDQAGAALDAFREWPDDRIDRLLEDLASAVADRAERFAIRAVEETRIGNVPDKTLKNRMASAGVCASLVGRPAAGAIHRDERRRITELACPAGVVFGMIPMTNPVATAIFKTLICLKGRNALILSFHRSTAGVGEELGELVREVLVRHGAPASLVQWVGQRNSRRTTNTFMRHAGVSLILATGGASMVRAAYASGTPALGVGPGNAPAMICSDADLDHAAECVVMSRSFDNGLICGAENHLVVDAQMRAAFVDALTRAGAAVLSEIEVERFVRAACDAQTGRLRRDTLGRSAQHIAERAGIERDGPIQVIVVPTRDAAPANPFAYEKLAPIVSLFTVAGDREGFDVCRDLLAVEGAGHTAIIHTRSDQTAARFGHAMPAGRILLNSPGSHGVIGYTTGLTPSLTLGCGTFGSNSTTDNVSYHHLLNIKRIAEFIPPGTEGDERRVFPREHPAGHG